MEQKKLTRKEYIESEYKKWEDQYEIDFGKEFEIKALLNLQYQFTITSPDHVKTLGDLVHTMNQIKRELNLKPKRKLNNNDKREYLFIVENAIQKLNIEELLTNSLKVENISSAPYSTKITTNEFKIHIKMNNNQNSLRGLRADTVLKIEDGSKLLN